MTSGLLIGRRRKLGISKSDAPGRHVRYTAIDGRAYKRSFKTEQRIHFISYSNLGFEQAFKKASYNTKFENDVRV